MAGLWSLVSPSGIHCGSSSLFFLWCYCVLYSYASSLTIFLSLCRYPSPLCCHCKGLALGDEMSWSCPWIFGSNVLKSDRVLTWLRSVVAFWFRAIVFLTLWVSVCWYVNTWLPPMQRAHPVDFVFCFGNVFQPSSVGCHVYCFICVLLWSICVKIWYVLCL